MKNTCSNNTIYCHLNILIIRIPLEFVSNLYCVLKGMTYYRHPFCTIVDIKNCPFPKMASRGVPKKDCSEIFNYISKKICVRESLFYLSSSFKVCNFNQKVLRRSFFSSSNPYSSSTVEKFIIKLGYLLKKE